MPVTEMRKTEGRGQDFRREPRVPFRKCQVWETQEPAMGQPAAVLAQTLSGLPEVQGVPGEPGVEGTCSAGGE